MVRKLRQILNGFFATSTIGMILISVVFKSIDAVIVAVLLGVLWVILSIFLMQWEKFPAEGEGHQC